MVDPNHTRLSIVRQCRLVSIARSSFYYESTGENPLTLRLMRLIDAQLLETPFFGSRQMTRWLRRQGDTVSRKRVRRLMRLLGVHTLFQRPRTSQPHPAHRIYPYLRRNLPITRPNHVWCTDVTYIPLQRCRFNRSVQQCPRVYPPASDSRGSCEVWCSGVAQSHRDTSGCSQTGPYA